MFLTNETLQAICRTFLHSIWQGMIAAALAGIILWGTRHSSARTRYNLLGLLLLLSLLTSGITFYAELGDTAAAIANAPATDIAAATAVLPQHPGQLIIQYLNQHASWFMMAWAFIFLVKCIRLLNGFYYIHRIRRFNTQAVPAHWEETLIKLSNALGIPKAVRLLESGLVKTPVTIGYFKPVIFLPLGLLTQLPADQVETILLHELAHIRRKDYLVNILHSFTETIFFFNPAFLWISARLREEREACCDDIVVAHTPHKATYLHALVAFEEQAVSGASLQLRLGSTKEHLLQRVKRMLTRENKKLTIMEKISLLFGLIAITAFSFMPEKETEKPIPVSPHSPESLVYHAPVKIADTLTPQKDRWVTIEKSRQDTWVAKEDKFETKEDKWVIREDDKFVTKEDKWVTKEDDKWVTQEEPSKKKTAPKKRITSTDTVRFKKPVFKDKYATDTIHFIGKKYKYSTDTVIFTKAKFKTQFAAKADTVRFTLPKLKKQLAATADTIRFTKPKIKKNAATVEFTKPAPKKIKFTTKDTVLFKKPLLKEDKKLSGPAFEGACLPVKKTWLEVTPEMGTVKKELLAVVTNKTYAPGDPKVIKKAPPALKPADKNIKKKENPELRSKFFGDYLPEGIREKVNPKVPTC